MMIMHFYKSNHSIPHTHQTATSSGADRNRRPGILRLWIRKALLNWERRKMIAILQAMDDHLLRDIGIERCDILRVVNGFTDRDLGMDPVARDVERIEEAHVHSAA
jgi:uncharacterized protein YjiS (DUF1127 family)